MEALVRRRSGVLRARRPIRGWRSLLCGYRGSFVVMPANCRSFASLRMTRFPAANFVVSLQAPDYPRTDFMQRFVVAGLLRHQREMRGRVRELTAIPCDGGRRRSR